MHSEFHAIFERQKNTHRTGKHPFVLGRLPTETNSISLLENEVELTLYYVKNNGELAQEETSLVWVLFIYVALNVDNH